MYKNTFDHLTSKGFRQNIKSWKKFILRLLVELYIIMSSLYKLNRKKCLSLGYNPRYSVKTSFIQIKVTMERPRHGLGTFRNKHLLVTANLHFL